MSIQSSSVSLSKEMSVEESYSKTSVSSSQVLSSTMESEESLTSIMDSKTGGGSTDLVAKLESELSLKDIGSSVTGTKMASLEKSSSITESESSLSYKKSEMSSSVDVEESSTSISMKKEQSMKMVSEEVSKTAISSSTYSESVSSEASEEKELPLYVVIMDYKPRDNDYEAIRVKEGQEVEVIDASKTHKWRVRLKKSGLEGTVPSCYLEKKASESASPDPLSPHLDPKVQATIARREKVLKELVESEEAFSRDMQFVVNNYIKEMESKQMPKDLRDFKDALFTNFKAISEFHNNVLMKGIQYYVNEPARLGKTFLRLERDFDMHVQYCKNEPEAQQLLLTGELKDYFDAFSRKLQDEKTLSEHLKLPIQRINDYQLLLKELIKYTARLKEDTIDLEKAHDFMQAIPQRIADLQYLNSIQGYKGNLHKLGRILKHDWFEVIEPSGMKRERFLFLFKGRIFITDHKRVGTNRSIFLVKHIIKLPEVEIVDNADDDELKMRFQSLKKGQSGYPLCIRAKTADQKEEWLNAIQVTATPQGIEDMGDEDLELAEDQDLKSKKSDTVEISERNGAKVEVLEDFEAYEEMHTVITESVRSGSLTSLDEGSEAILECEICSSPEATVAWLKDNSPMHATQRAIIESDGGKHRLLLKKTEAADSGLYTIIASNINGTVSCSAPLAVHSAPEMLPPSTPGGTPMAYAPMFLEKLHDIELQEGTNFRTCVVIQGEPQPDVKFYKDDQEIKSEGRVRAVKESRECYELAIDNVTAQDAGKYSCTAISSSGQTTSSCTFSVTKQKEIFKKSGDESDKISTPDIMDLEQQGLKDGVNGKGVEASERFKVEIDETQDTVSLVFQHVTPGDAGMYTCVANTESGKISCSAELTVQGGIPREPEAPKATASVKEVVAKEGASALLELAATGFPKPKITWSKDDKELKPGDKYAVMQEDDESYTMAIKDVTADDSGNYSVLAKNELGESKVDYELKVTSPPKFIKRMQDMSVMLDEDIKFEVEIQGTPEPSITWCKDGQPLSDGDRIKLVEDGAVRKLVVKKAKMEDTGNYSCTIKNTEGTQAGFGAVQISSPAKFVQGLKDSSVSLGQDLTLKIKITGTPKPDRKWSKDGSKLEIDGSHIAEKEETSGSYCLVVKETTKKDSGKYACEISNTYGKDESTAVVVVKEKPTFGKKMEDRTVKEGEKNVDIAVEVSGSPTPKIKWYIGDMEIKESSNYQIISSEDTGKFTLRIKEVTSEIEGQYKCEATNEAGTTSSSCNVTVKKEVKKVPPKFVKGLSDTEVKEGEDASFNIKLSGTPKPDAKWTKDNADLHTDGKHLEYKVEEDGDSLTLVIRKATKDDEGKYSCTITNTEGTETSTSKVTIKASEKSPSFQQKLQDKTIKEAETVELTVKYDGLPKPIAKWTKDGAEVTIDGKHVESKEKADSLTLIIRDATKEDSGKYTCTIKNTSGSETTCSKLTVTESTESAKFVKGLKDQTVKESEEVEFTVKFQGKPKPSAKWSKDGAELTIDGKHFEYKKEEAEDSLTLIIHKVTKEDTGKYSCTISNSEGSDTSSCEVKVSEITEKAKFVCGLKDLVVKEEEDVEFTVKLQGKPKPSAKWTKDGAELTIDGKHWEYKKEEAEDSLTLILHKATKEDAGKYSCTISNSAGSDTSSSELKVTEKTVAAKFVKGLTDQTVKEEENVEFVVKFTGKPKPSAKWSKDGAELTIDGTHYQYTHEEAEDSLTLILNKARKEDSGEYSCTISNSAGSDTTNSVVKVTELTTGAKFVQGLKDQSAKEDQTVKFMVKIQGKPKPTVKWTKDEAELTIDGKHVEYKVDEAGDTLTLIIHQVTKEDGGKYSCAISNSAGSDTTSSKLTVTDTVFPPEFTEGLKDKDVKIGESIKLTVKFCGKPKPSMNWTLDGTELIIDGKHLELQTSEGEATLQINNATQEDSGKYSCVLTNSCGTKSSSGKLTISIPPTILQKLEDVEGEINGTIRLNVKFEGKPEPTVTWKKDGTALNMDGKHLKTAIEADDSFTLVIDKVTTDDVGSYSCELKNPHGSASTSGKVTVTGKPVIKSPLKDKEILNGEKDVEFTAQVKATPPPNITWSLNGKEISSGDVWKIDSDENKGLYKLVIKEVKLEVEGEYSLEAKNSSGVANTSAKLKVLEKPMFVKDLGDVQTLEGEVIRLEAVVKGCPDPTAKWFKGKKELKSDDHCNILQEGKTFSLTIKDCCLEDSGAYICKIKNNVGEATQTANVTVKSKKDTQSPTFLTHLSDQVIVVGDAVRMEVKIAGKPQPLATWYRNKEEMKESEEVTIKFDESERTYTLTIKNLKTTDTGSYSCKAVNEYGEAMETAVLTVKEPVAPNIEGMEDLKVVLGSPARIKAKVFGFPIPEVKWLKDGELIAQKSETYKITEDPETNKHAVSINSVTESETGEFKCIASNCAGQDESACKLSVKPQAPVIMKELKDQSVCVDDTFKFQIEVHGYPTPVITWYKDNISLEKDSRFVSSKKDNVVTLLVESAIIKDAGIYSCKAKNDAGEASSRASLKIEDFAPKIVEKLPSSIKLVEGDGLHLKAKVSGQPTPEVKWLKDSKPLKLSDKIKMSLSPDGTAELTVDDVSHEDSGNYKLQATNSKGHSSTESDVDVEFRPKNSKPFVRQLKPLDVVTGASFKLEAKVSGHPKPKILWTKDGTPLSETPSGARAQISETAEGVAVLSIERAADEDSGEYTVTATNEVGEDVSSAQVTVSAPGKKPMIVKELKPAKFIEGDSGKLEAVISGHPPPTVTWMRNGKNVIEGASCSATLEPNGLASLTFSQITKEDGGLYTLTASNKLGKAMTEAPLIVIPLAVKEEEKKPKKTLEFLKGLMPALVPEGRPCKLEVQVTTDPKPVSVKWCKDGKELLQSEHLEMIQDLATGVLKLVIPQMSPDDRGKYSIFVSDGHAEVKSEALVNMIPAMPGMSANKPYFLRGLEPITLYEGETLNLQAQLAPEFRCSIKWMKDGDDLVSGERINIVSHGDGSVGATITGVTADDSGKYVVIASNEEGKTRSSALVAVVGDGFKLPEIVNTLKPAQLLEGQPGRLEAKVDGEPKPDVKWLRDGCPLEPSDKIRMVQEPDGTVALEIEGVTPEDAGKYTLIVANVGGETRCSAPVDVKRPPIFAKPLADLTAVEGLPNKLECKITGEPTPSITWAKDGVEVLEDAEGRVRKVSLPDGTSALIFNKCSPEDSGVYQCQATNPHGEKKSDARVKVLGKDVEGTPTCVPSFVTPLSDVTVADGDSFILSATVSGNPLPNVTWCLDDQPIMLSNRVFPAFDGKKVTLSVHNCNTSEGGIYTCKLSNTVGDASSKAKVSIKANQPPRFIEKLSDMKFSTEEPMKLVCRVEGLPDPEIEWYCNGSKLENGLKYNLSREGDKCILVVTRPRNKDSGVYECRARNMSGKDSCAATISISGVDAEGEPAMFLKKLRDTDGLTGMTIKLTACIAGVPKPDIKWFKEGEQLSPDSRRTFEVDRNGVIRLLIRNAQKADAGTYRVSIFNMFGSESCTADLRIEGKDKAEYIPQKMEKVSKTGPPAPLPHAPYIFKMDDTSLSLGWRPSIPCYPQVPSLYRLEVRRVPDGDWSTYKEGIKDCACDVRDLKPVTDYEFRVRVENRYGSSDPSPYVTAHRTQLRPPTPGEFKPKDYEIEHPPLDKYAAAPRFLRKEEEEIYGVKGQPARVEFWVYGCPQPKVTWYFNNIPIEVGKYDFLEDRNGQVILFISRMIDTDVGTYTCKAVNEHGEAQQQIKLLIAEPAIFTQRLAPITVMIRQGGEFVCQVMGVPNPKIKWFKDWHPLSESSRIQMRFEEPNKHVLSLSSAILKDSGFYSCVASNVAGSSTTAGMLTVEESEQDYHISTYKKPCFTKASDRAFEDYFDIGEELGRGTQGITYHAVDRTSGKSYGAKAMHGTGQLLDFMTHEMDIMGQLCHPRLLRLWSAYQTKSSLTLAMDMCGGGELLPHILQQPVLTETLVAQYIKQILEGLQHMHSMNIAHLGLTIGDILVTRVNSDSIKIGDFGLATRLYPGRDYIQEYGHPEYVAPEVANKQSVSLASDMWSVGIISHLLLTGVSPFLRENDRETLKEVQKGKVNFFYDGFAALSDEARDFVSQLLTVDPSQRMSVNEALKHKWLALASVPDRCDELENMERLREYHKRWKSWYANASCRRYYRRRTLESCFTHPSRMIYPPDEEYTPPVTPDLELSRSHVKPSAFDDVTFQQRIEREPIDVRSESHYQNGPDTFLLPLRDPDFPVRIRRYLKVGANRSPILARHLQDKHWGYSDVAVKERRKFMDVMDEEIDDEKRGVSRSAPLRLRHEVGTLGSGYDHLECKALRKMRGFRIPPGSVPFFREKIKDVVIRENENAVFSCTVASELEAQFSWFRNDGILIESSRINIKKWSDGRCTLTLNPAKAYDVGVYKCVARNSHGVSVCRARLNIGSAPGKPEPPKTEKCSDTEVYVTWLPPKYEGHSPTLGYSLECREEGDENWTKIASNISHEFFLVKNLKPSTTYYFHISAINRFGWSEFSLPSEPTLTLAESATKLELSRAQSYQQELTESGQPLVMEEDEHAKLDYGVEEEPITMEEGEPTELYNFISDISRGRFSLVTKLWVKKVNAACVAKVCHITDSNKEAVEHEFEIYKSLRHERIAQLHSASCSANSMFLVMEKLSGIDVLTYLSSRPLYTEETVSRIIHQVIDALEYLHFRSICYFELQPDNVVMVERHSHDVKLVDFGSAQYLPEPGAKVQVKGCIEYLAPEVVKGEEVRSSADIWGVGVLTYILLSGVSPFAGDNALETKDNVLFVRYHFDHLYKEVSQEATHFIMQLFKRTPQKRPTAEECLENKWLLPNEFMIKKREHTVFLPHQLREFSEQFHSAKSKSTPPALLNIFGKPLPKSSVEE